LVVAVLHNKHSLMNGSIHLVLGGIR